MSHAASGLWTTLAPRHEPPLRPLWPQCDSGTLIVTVTSAQALGRPAAGRRATRVDSETEVPPAVAYAPDAATRANQVQLVGKSQITQAPHACHQNDEAKHESRLHVPPVLENHDA
jgi:hypothetical protein